MAISIEDDVVWLEVSEYDVPLVQVLQGKQDLCQVHPGSLLREPPVLVECPAHVASMGVVQQEEQLLRCLECILQAHYEWVLGVCEHISLRLGILDQVLPQDLLLVQYLH